MTEKRFSWVKNTHNKYGIIIDNKTGKDVMGTKETCYFMNKLNDENEQLKEFIKTLATDGKVLLMNGNVYDVKKIIGDVDD